MELETIDGSDQSAHLAVLLKFCNYSLRIQGIKNATSNVSEHIAHVDLCSD